MSLTIVAWLIFSASVLGPAALSYSLFRQANRAYTRAGGEGLAVLASVFAIFAVAPLVMLAHLWWTA